MLVFSPWLKDVEMCVKEWKLINLEVVLLIKDYTAENVRGVVKFYLDTNSTWDYQELMGYLRRLFESSETISSSGDLYSRVKQLQETEDQFVDEL